MKILVLGGKGFIGRQVASALKAKGAEVIIGSRKAIADKNNIREIKLHEIQNLKSWLDEFQSLDMIVNCVGILRERSGETYEAIHIEAPATMANACAQLNAIHPYICARANS